MPITIKIPGNLIAHLKDVNSALLLSQTPGKLFFELLCLKLWTKRQILSDSSA